MAHHSFKPVSVLAISLIARAYANARSPADLCDFTVDIDMAGGQGRAGTVLEKDRMVGE